MHYTKGRHFRRTLRGLAPCGALLALGALGTAVVVFGAPPAYAQITPGMTPGMGSPPPGGGAPGGGSDEKKEGVAEAAPKTPGLLPTTPALPAPKGRRKRWKLLELDGYYRLRTDWFKNFNLGFPDPGYGGTPFPTALGCKSTVTGTSAPPCDNSVGGANMRLRLEPTLNLDEGTSVHVQADLLDNLVLGSTPSDISLASGAYPLGTSPPLAAFGNGTQAPVIQGVNSDRPSIEIKRAWGEIALPLGVLKVGRMPNQWGMGIFHNAGGADPINGTYNYDADYGDSVDRVSFSALIPGSNLRGMVALDWASNGLASNQVADNALNVGNGNPLPPSKGNEGHPFDLDDSDDAFSYVGVISRIDSPQEFRDTLDRGELAINWGVYFEYKTQAWDYDLTGFTLGSATDAGGSVGSPHYVARNLTMYTPDLWAKVGLGHYLLEAEFVAQLGSFNAPALAVDGSEVPNTSITYNVRKFGGASRFTWRNADDKLKLGMEIGFASGDQWDNNPQGATNIAYANPLGGTGDTTLSQFVFNRDYNIDLLMWRHLFGAVTNAVYVKPFLQFDVTKGVTFKVANITSFAMKPVATPGNSPAYGTEFDADLGYSTGNGVFIGLSYGVLFPLGAMNHPADDPITNETFGYKNPTTGDTTNVKDADTAHIIQSRFVLAF